MASVMVTCRFKWKLWFLTVTFGCLLLSYSLNEVGAFQIQTASTLNKIPPPNSHVDQELEPVQSFGTKPAKSNEERGTKSKPKLIEAGDSFGYAAEWEYTGSAEFDDYEPSETKHQKESSETQSKKIKPGMKIDVPYPSRRIGPGSWVDANGHWWIYGGQGPAISSKNQTAIHYLSDLWVYGPPQPQVTSTSDASSEGDQIPSWRLVYRPESGGESPLSSHPENVVFPLLCGSDKSGHLSLFGGQPRDPSRPLGTESHNSMFTEDGVVWLYDIPPSFEKIPRRTIKSGGSGCNWSGKERSCNGTGGLWTSYICCDACLPDGNTTFDFCPQFSRERILWCNQDSLMAFQLGLTTSKSEAQGKQPASSSSTFVPRNEIPEESQQRNNVVRDSNNVATTEESSFTPTSHISQNITTGESMKNGSNSQGVGQPPNKAERGSGGENEKKASAKTFTNGKSPKQDMASASIQLTEQQTKDEMNNRELKKEINTTKVSNGKTTETAELNDVVGGTGRLVVNWWKFDLTATEWVKMPEVNINSEGAEQVRSGSCRTVSDQDLLYILCPTKTNLLERSVQVFDPSKGDIQTIGTIHLNNAYDKKVWHLGRSVFYALRSKNQTVIFIAYHKLLDLWIHDHSSNRLYAVENVWKGSTAMYTFQHTSSFYKLTIVLPSSSSFTDNNGQRATSAGDERIHSFYMANPRSKLFTFDDPFPDGHFRITIVTDRAVFLPSRDAPYLINSTDLNHKSVYNPEKASSVQNRSFASAFTTTTSRALTANASSIKYEEDPFVKASLLPAHNGEMGFKGLLINETTVVEEMTTETVTGLRKVQGSNLFSTKASRTGVSDPFTATNTTSGDAGTRIPDSVAVAMMASQLKSNATPTNYNKTNNSQLKSRVELIPGLKKRILGIKRSFSGSKIDPPSPLDTSSIISTSNITSSHSANTIRYTTGRSSLQVNNESNRKPLSTSSESSRWQENFPSTDMPRVMKVLNENPARRIASEKTAFPYRNKNTTTRKTEANYDGVNLSASPQVSALRVAVQAEHHQPLRPESLTATLAWAQPKNSSSTQAYTRSRQEADQNYNLDDRPNLENNYVPHPPSGSAFPKKNESHVMTPYNQSFVDGMDTNPLTYGSSEILIDSPNDDIQSIAEEDGNSSSYSSLGSLLFFSLSLSLFASVGLVWFFRRCVKCPPRNESVLLKEPPPIHYSVVPDELSFHMPIV